MTSIQSNTEVQETEETLVKACGEKPVFESISAMSLEEKDAMLTKIKMYSMCLNDYGGKNCIDENLQDSCVEQNELYNTQCKNFGEIMEYTGFLENRFDPLNAEFFKICNACVIESCQSTCNNKDYESCLERNLFNIPMIDNLKNTELNTKKIQKQLDVADASK